MPARELRFEPLDDKLGKVVGKGISFPFAFSARGRSKEVSTRGGAEKINQSIHQILSTRPGERMFLPNFGSRLPELVFEPETDILYHQLYLETVTALERWEKRIEVTAVKIIDSNAMVEQFKTDNNTVGIAIEYQIRANHVHGSYIYPFMLGATPFRDTL